GRRGEGGLRGVSGAGRVPRVRLDPPGEGRRLGRLHRAGAPSDHPPAPAHGLTVFAVRRIRADEGPRLRSIRLAALADAPGDATTTLARAEARGDDHWAEAAVVNASGGLQATFFAELAGDDGIGLGDEPVGLIGAYFNETGIVNLVGLWTAPGH